MVRAPDTARRRPPARSASGFGSPVTMPPGRLDRARGRGRSGGKRRPAGAFAVLLATWCSITAAATGAPSATLERNPIRANETVRLIIETDPEHAAGEPDLTPLTKDFEVLGTSTNTRIRILNGKQSATTRWIIELAPRRSGALQVPPLSLGAFATRALTLSVLEAPPAGGGAGREIFIESEIFPKDPYVQSQVTYALRLFRAVEILDGTLEEPRAGDALVEKLGRDLGYAVTRHGRRYRVIERRYALFPQSSGELRIPPVRFDGEVADPGTDGSSLSRLFARGRRVRLDTGEHRVEVRPRPPEFQGQTWLPARTVHFIEQWSEDPPELEVGVPMTRTLTLRGAGLRGDQLPEIEIGTPDGIRVYPDQPTTRTSTDAELVYGLREQRFALVPVRAGEATVPEIRIRWWDVASDAPREAVVPARSFNVAAAPADATGLAAAISDQGAVRAADTPGRAGGGGAGVWRWLSAALLVLWAATGLGWWRSHRRAKEASREDPRTPAMSRARRALGTACTASRAGDARDALLQWAAAAWPEAPPRSLGEAARRLGPALATRVQELDRVLYAPGEEPWNGQALWREAKAGLESPRAERTRPPPGLVPLYPDRHRVAD